MMSSGMARGLLQSALHVCSLPFTRFHACAHPTVRRKCQLSLDRIERADASSPSMQHSCSSDGWDGARTRCAAPHASPCVTVCEGARFHPHLASVRLSNNSVSLSEEVAAFLTDSHRISDEKAHLITSYSNCPNATTISCFPASVSVCNFSNGQADRLAVGGEVRAPSQMVREIHIYIYVHIYKYVTSGLALPPVVLCSAIRDSRARRTKFKLHVHCLSFTFVGAGLGHDLRKYYGALRQHEKNLECTLIAWAWA